MKSSAEFAFCFRVIPQIIIIIIICYCETSNIKATEEAHITIVRRFKSDYTSRIPKLIPDKFVLHQSNCTHPWPYHCCKQTKQSLVTSIASQCECVCAEQQPTIGYVNHKWRCVRDDLAHRLCSIRFINEDAKGIFLVKKGSWEDIRLWRDVNGYRCKVDWSKSGVLQCNNTITSIKTPPETELKITNGRYWLKFLTITREVEGRIMKVGIHCRDGNPPANHCLMLKVAGAINCPIVPLLPPTTSIPTTTFFPTTVNDDSTQASTDTTTTRGSGETEQRAGGDSGVPIIPIAGGVAAVLVLLAILAVFLFYRRKHQRKIGRSLIQGAQQRQAEHRLSEDVYYSNIKSPSTNVKGVYAGAPVYEKVPDQENDPDVPIDGGVEAIATLSHSNQEYDCIWTGVEIDQPLQTENTEQLGSEYYDYARPDGPPDNGDTQDGMYDVPECEDGTVRPLPEQNYYEEAGAVIQGEEIGEAANQERQDTTDDVTANPLYSFAFTGGSGNTPN